MSDANKTFRDIITFIGPGKTGTSSIYDAVKQIGKFDLVSDEYKELYIHSFKDVKKGSYRNLIWEEQLINKFTNDFNKKNSDCSPKKLILVEPSYADSENALDYCSSNSQTIVITIRPVLKRICSHLIMDSRLGILNLNNLQNNKLFLERFYYYLSLSNYAFLYERLKLLGTNMGKVCFLDLKKRLIYSNSKNLVNLELIKKIANIATRNKTNPARVPKNKLIEYLYKNKNLRKISRVKLLKKLKDYFNNNSFHNLDIKKKEHLEEIIYKIHKSSIESIEYQNNFLLSSKTKHSI